MTHISHEFMRERISKTRAYTIVILKTTSRRTSPGADKIVWEHGRRNFVLREEGKLSIVCPINDGSEVAGLGIFNASVHETQKIMEEDPGVQAGIFTYEVHAARGFPGDALPV